MLDLTWVFSIFKISRADCGSDSHARNFRLRGNFFRHHNVKSRRDDIFSIPDLNLASTSASIFKAGLHKVWRTTGKSKACPKASASQHGHIPQPKSAPILTHIPFPQTRQPERQPADTQHPSRSWFFHLHKAVNKEPDFEQSTVRPPTLENSRASPFSHPAAVPSRLPIVPFGSSAVKGSEITQRNVGLNIFTAGQCSSSHSSFQVTFLPNTALPSPSLLFLPPTPPPKRKNLEGDIVLLPPASEPNLKSNLFVTAYPVRRPDHKFPINILPSPSLPTDHTVPCSPLFPTQSSNNLSPLPIAMSFSPQAVPPPPELVIKIAGPEGCLNADPRATSTDVANSLVVIWQLSHIDGGGRRGLESLKALFAQLDEKVLESNRTALSKFTKISITIPDQVKDVAPYDDLPQPAKEDDRIDLANAMDLHEFAWHGDFVIFATKFKNLSLMTLTCLNIKTSNISIEDAITLLHSCSVLQKVSLGTIRSEEDSDAIMSMKSRCGIERKSLPNLTYLALESDVALHPLIRRFCWTAQVSLSLTLRKQGTASLVHWQALDSGLQ